MAEAAGIPAFQGEEDVKSSQDQAPSDRWCGPAYVRRM